MKNILLKIGLTQSEIKVYNLLCTIDSTTVSNLTSQTNLYRTNIYDILKKLTKKGLVKSIKKNNVQHFSITEPKNLLRLLEEKEKEIKSSKTDLLDFISNIKLKSQKSLENNISIFQGRDGLEFFYDQLIDIAKSKDEILLIASSITVLNVFNYYFLNLSKRIKHINVKGRMIANKKIIHSTILKKVMSHVNLKLRFLPKGYVSPVAVFIFKNNIGFCNFMENPFVIIIDDQSLSKSYKKHFEELWKKSSN
jgi:sugar-specific transcriptional regulator TrmB